MSSIKRGRQCTNYSTYLRFSYPNCFNIPTLLIHWTEKQPNCYTTLKTRIMRRYNLFYLLISFFRSKHMWVYMLNLKVFRNNTDLNTWLLLLKKSTLLSFPRKSLKKFKMMMNVVSVQIHQIFYWEIWKIWMMIIMKKTLKMLSLLRIWNRAEVKGKEFTDRLNPYFIWKFRHFVNMYRYN